MAHVHRRGVLLYRVERWRMRVPLTRHGSREIIVGTLFCWSLGGVSIHFHLWPLTVVFAALWGFLLLFFRDPERHCASREDQLLSPADGTVTDIEEVEAPPFLGGKATRIGIFMSIFNVHVNRAPAPGTVRFVQYVKGKFHSAHSKKSSLENEHNFVGLETQGGGRILVNLIAGVIARRIVCTVSPGQALSSGQRIGMVKFGSRAELYLPGSDRYEVLVSPGAKVKAGRDVLAVRKDAGHGAGVS